MTEMLKNMATRRSVVANLLSGPGPSQAQLSHILEIGARVPDHGKLEPWRFIVFEGDARQDFGAELSRIFKGKNLEAGKDRLEVEKNRFMRAPQVICVVSSLKDSPKIPDWEQVLSSGAVCQNILLAAMGYGFSAQWITEWYAYDPEVSQILGLGDKEEVAGFIYIGSAGEPPVERQRPDMASITQYWKK